LDASIVPLAVLAVLAVLFLWMPLLGLVLICLFAAWGEDRNLRWVFLLSACVLFCTLNATKLLDGDFTNYVNLQTYLAGRSVTTLMNPDELAPFIPNYRSTELGFYGMQWLLAQLNPSASASLTVAVTLGIYVPTFAAVIMLGRIKGWNDRLTLIVALFAFFAAINFNNTAHVMRQYMSGAFAFLALVSFCGRRTWLAVAWALVACSMHNGLMYVIGCFVVAVILLPYGRPFRSRPWSSAWRVLCALGVLGGSVAMVWLHELSGLVDKGDLTVARYMVSCTLFALFWYVTRTRGQDRSDYYVALAFVVTLFISGSFFVIHQEELALRYFFYLEWLYVPLVAAILCAVPRRHLMAYLGSRWLISCAAVCIFVVRVYTSTWNFGPGNEQILTMNAREVMEYIGM
jgi:hypothetical protein